MALKFRRGTTAQKSGSLAFGEPYVNTDLGTLQIGGAGGDITLGTSGTGSQGSFAGISGSSLDITGNAKIDGNLTLGGQLTIGDQSSDTVNVVASLSSSLIPQTTNAFDLGSTSKIWRDLYISTGSIKFVANGAVVSTLSINPSGSQNFPSGAIVTGSLVTTGSKVEFNVQWPGAPAEQHIVKTNPFSLEGRNYEYAAIALEHYEDTPGTYHNAIVTYMYNSGSTFGVESMVSPFRSHMQVYPSGSGGSPANVSVQDLKNGQTQALVYGDFVQIGAYHAESIIIGNSGSVVEISGSIRAASGFTGSIAATNGVVSGSSQIVSILTSLNSFSASNGNTSLNAYTASNDTTNTTQNARLVSLESATASLFIDTNNLETFSASVLGHIADINSKTGSYARTNSTNIFTGNQTITGSLYVSQDLVVAGSSSIQNISSSNLVIGAAYVTLNTNSPSSRYAGLLIIDSGSAGSSGSILYDAVDDELLFIHKGNGTNVTSSHFLCGPETYDNVGNEIYLTKNRVLKGGGYEHLADSNINDDGTTISLNSNTKITGSLVVSAGINGTINAFNGVVSGSSQITGIGNAQLTNSSITIAGTSTALGGAITAEQIRTAIGTVVTGSSQITGLSNAQLTNSSVTVTAGTGMSGGGAVSLGSSITLTNAGVTSNVAGSGISVSGATGAVTITNSGVTSAVAGTGVSVSGATGAVTISIGQAVATSSSPTFAGLTINGAITATGDITAYYSSDRRFKSNIQLIPDALQKVTKLNGVTWTWNDDVNEVTKTTPNTGLIAQEVQEVLPEVVMEREDGHLGLDYSKMVGLLVEAIKEQQTQIHSLTLEIEKLKESKGL
jgi:hypothetical protein